jgi:hypothetical protein
LYDIPPKREPPDQSCVGDADVSGDSIICPHPFHKFSTPADNFPQVAYTTVGAAAERSNRGDQPGAATFRGAFVPEVEHTQAVQADVAEPEGGGPVMPVTKAIVPPSGDNTGVEGLPAMFLIDRAAGVCSEKSTIHRESRAIKTSLMLLVPHLPMSVSGDTAIENWANTAEDRLRKDRANAPSRTMYRVFLDKSFRISISFKPQPFFRLRRSIRRYPRTAGDRSQIG